MKKFIFGNNGNTSTSQKTMKLIVTLIGLWAVFFLPMSYTLPILLTVAFVRGAIRADGKRRIIWGAAAFFVMPGINLFLKAVLIAGVVFLSFKRENWKTEKVD